MVVCVCVRACACACVRVRVFVFVCLQKVIARCLWGRYVRLAVHGDYERGRERRRESERDVRAGKREREKRTPKPGSSPAQNISSPNSYSPKP